MMYSWYYDNGFLGFPWKEIISNKCLLLGALLICPSGLFYFLPFQFFPLLLLLPGVLLQEAQLMIYTKNYGMPVLDPLLPFHVKGNEFITFLKVTWNRLGCFCLSIPDLFFKLLIGVLLCCNGQDSNRSLVLTVLFQARVCIVFVVKLDIFLA